MRHTDKGSTSNLNANSTEEYIYMTSPLLLVWGSALLGWLLSELLSRDGGRVPMGMNFLGAISGALISGAFVL